MKGRYHCFWRRRVGDYRVIYRILETEGLVRVVEICHRSQCY
jgi:mRNA-degrading endonuclease RelE of RelBE toxin-antitoxin system